MSQRGQYQDYIARIRYANTLPPPPGPPKLLNIPGTGLGDGKYTSAAYASRLARQQPLNIEADAELGMPIDLVGLPGVFDGDDSCILALSEPPPIHPDDKGLLKPATALGRDTNQASAIFQRRSELGGSQDANAKRLEAQQRRVLANGESARKKLKTEHANLEEPATMIRDIEKSFHLANATSGAPTNPELVPSQEKLRQWKQPVHPSNPSLKLLDAYPLLPDMEAMPDLGSWMVTRFMGNPGRFDSKYDSRLDVALLRPIEPSQQVRDEYEEQVRLHELDPKHAAHPGPPKWDFGLYLLGDDDDVKETKKEIVEDAIQVRHEGDDADDRPPHTFNYIRNYGTNRQDNHFDDLFNTEVAIALHDPNSGGRRNNLAKAAYVYPIAQNTSLQPKGASDAYQGDEAEKIDAITLKLRRATEDENSQRQDKAKEIY